jgi:hypothetical protein
MCRQMDVTQVYDANDFMYFRPSIKAGVPVNVAGLD